MHLSCDAECTEKAGGQGDQLPRVTAPAAGEGEGAERPPREKGNHGTPFFHLRLDTWCPSLPSLSLSVHVCLLLLSAVFLSFARCLCFVCVSLSFIVCPPFSDFFLAWCFLPLCFSLRVCLSLSLSIIFLTILLAVFFVCVFVSSYLCLSLSLFLVCTFLFLSSVFGLCLPLCLKATLKSSM